jgi:hypothetical protein
LTVGPLRKNLPWQHALDDRHQDAELSTDAPEQDSAALRTQLTEVAGVEHVAVDPVTGQIWLILRAHIDPEWTLQQARSLAPGRDVQVAFRPEHRDRQRVRFVEVHREVQPDQQVAYRVTLEWAGVEYHGRAVGDKGDSVELRTAASAALDSVGAIVAGGLPIKLAGVKHLKAFDAELVVVSLYRPEGDPHNLVGAVVAGGDNQRAAVISVLSGLNRLLGNYLLLP